MTRLTNARLPDGRRVDLTLQNGRIAAITPHTGTASIRTTVPTASNVPIEAASSPLVTRNAGKNAVPTAAAAKTGARNPPTRSASDTT